jgi:hypothetical protein
MPISVAHALVCETHVVPEAKRLPRSYFHRNDELHVRCSKRSAFFGGVAVITATINFPIKSPACRMSEQDVRPRRALYMDVSSRRFE